MGKEKLFNGGEFLIVDALPEEIFAPEDFTKDQRQIAQAAGADYVKTSTGDVWRVFVDPHLGSGIIQETSGYRPQ